MHSDKNLTPTSLVTQAYWDKGYEHSNPTIAPPEDPMRQWLGSVVPPASGEQHCLEIGCYPGRYLGVIGKAGYVVHGIDLTPAVDRMKVAFDAEGLSTGAFIHADFLSHRFERRYDMVCSFGFIEHFRDWQTILLKHAELVRPGGTLVITTPNFRGWVQQLIHRTLDGPNLRRHHLPAMAPDEWAALLEKAGFEVITHGYHGRFDFWTESPPPDMFQRMIFRSLRVITPLLERIRPGSRALSPYCVLMARKATGAE